MFGNYEGLAQALANEKIRQACCRGGAAEWCSLECEKVKRYG